MIAAMAVFFLGAVITATGLLEPTMYDIGIMVMFLGSIGIAVRTVELARWLWR
jgi:Sec-independent protein secretion pathway component TatC